MSAEQTDLVQRLVKAFPVLDDEYEAHLENNGEVLPHVFSAIDLMQAVVGAYLGLEENLDLDWAGVLAFLDRELAADEPDGAVRRVIVTSFAEDLPHSDQPGYGIINHLGPNLAEAFSAIRPGG